MKNKILIGVVLASLIIGAGTLRRGHEWGDDWAWYVLQARSIWEGTTEEFIEISDFTNYQSTTHLGPLAYPWGYPLILTPFYAINGISPLTLKLPGLILFAGFLVCLYMLVKNRFTQSESLLFVSLFAFNPLLIQFLDHILSDIPFLFFSTLTLVLVMQKQKQGWMHYALIGASIFFTTFLRATGILLLGCFLIIEFFKLVAHRIDRETIKRIILNSFVVCSVFTLLWVANALLLPGGGESYLSQYENLTLDLVKGFIGAYFKVFGWFFGEGDWIYVYYLVLLFSLLGAWIRRTDELYFILFFMVWMLVHITYPYWQGPRYIFPLLPIFIYFAFHGMKTTVNKLPENYHLTGQRVFYGFWFAIVGYFLFTSSSAAYYNVVNGRQINGPFDPVSMEVYDFVKRKTPSDSVLIFYKARAMRLMTDYDTIMINECDGMLKGDYLILSKKVGENNQVPPEQIDSCNLPLDKIFDNRRFIIYEIQK